MRITLNIEKHNLSGIIYPDRQIFVLSSSVYVVIHAIFKEKFVFWLRIFLTFADFVTEKNINIF